MQQDFDARRQVTNVSYVVHPRGYSVTEEYSGISEIDSLKRTRIENNFCSRFSFVHCPKAARLHESELSIKLDRLERQ